MKELIKRHYEATRKRGQITRFTSPSEFMGKLEEEFKEVEDAYCASGFDGDTIQECMDVVGVIFNMMIHYDIDIEAEFEYNVKHQESRI